MAEEEFVEALDPVITTNTKKRPRKKKVKKTVAEIEAPVDDQYLHASKGGKTPRQKGQRGQRRKSRSPSPQPGHALTTSSGPSEQLTVSAEAESAKDSEDLVTSKGLCTSSPQDLAKSEDEEDQISDQDTVGGSPELSMPTSPAPSNSDSSNNGAKTPSLAETASVSPSPKETKDNSPSSAFVKTDFTVKISPEDALTKIKKDIAFVKREILESASMGGDGNETCSLCLGEIDMLLTVVGLGFAESAQKVYDLSVAVNKMATENKRLMQELAAAKARAEELEARPPPPLPEADFEKLRECEKTLAECLQVVRPGEIVGRQDAGTPAGEISASESIDRTLGLCRKLVGSCSDAMTTLSNSEMALVQVKGDLRDAQESYFFSLALSIKQNLLSSNAAKGAELNSVPDLFDMATRLKIPSSEWPKWISDNLVK